MFVDFSVDPIVVYLCLLRAVGGYGGKDHGGEDMLELEHIIG